MINKIKYGLSEKVHSYIYVKFNCSIKATSFDDMEGTDIYIKSKVNIDNFFTFVLAIINLHY